MFLKALLAFLVLPCILGILLSILLGFIDPWWRTVFFFAVGVIGLGSVVLLWCVRDFYVTGKGTLVPWASSQNLVI